MNLVMRAAVIAVAGLISWPAGAAESPALAERIAGLEPFIGAYPPTFASEAEAKAVLARYDALKQELDAQIKTSPGDLDLLFLRGELQALGHNADRQGAWDGATADLQQVLRAQPQHVPALLALGRLWVNSRPDLAPKAENLFRAAQCFTGEVPLEEAQRGMFFAFYFQGRMQAALQQSEYLVKTWPDVKRYRELSDMVRSVVARQPSKASSNTWAATPLTMTSCK